MLGFQNLKVLIKGITFFREFLGPVMAGVVMDHFNNFKVVSSIYSAVLYFVVSELSYLFNFKSEILHNLVYKPYFRESGKTLQVINQRNKVFFTTLKRLGIIISTKVTDRVRYRVKKVKIGFRANLKNIVSKLLKSN